MILFGRKHLHVSESDQIIDRLFKIMSSVSSGSIKLEVANQPAMKIEINTNDDQVDGDDNNRTSYCHFVQIYQTGEDTNISH